MHKDSGNNGDFIRKKFECSREALPLHAHGYLINLRTTREKIVLKKDDL